MAIPFLFIFAIATVLLPFSSSPVHAFSFSSIRKQPTMANSEDAGIFDALESMVRAKIKSDDVLDFVNSFGGYQQLRHVRFLVVQPFSTNYT